MNELTISIPTYNGEKTLRKALESVFRKPDYISNVFIIDDASKDSTVSIAREYQKKYPIITVIENKVNIGYQINWNKCMELCPTKYLLILHQDDELLPDSIKLLYSYIIENKDVALVGGRETRTDNINYVNAYPKIYNKVVKFNRGEILEFIEVTGSYIPCSTVMFDMRKIKEVGFFNTKFLGTDELFWPKILNYFPIAMLNQNIILRGIHDGQTSSRHFRLKFNEIIISGLAQYEISEYEKKRERKKKVLKILKKKMSNNCLNIANNLTQGDKKLKLSLKYFIFGMRQYPKVLLSKTIILYLKNLFNAIRK